MSNTDGDGSVSSSRHGSSKKSSRLQSISGRSIGKLKSKMILKRGHASGEKSDGSGEASTVGREGVGRFLEGESCGPSPQDGRWWNERGNDDGDTMATKGVPPVYGKVDCCPTLHDEKNMSSCDMQEDLEEDLGVEERIAVVAIDGKDGDRIANEHMNTISTSVSDTPFDSSSSSSMGSPSPVAKVPKLDLHAFHDPVPDPGQNKENRIIVANNNVQKMAIGAMDTIQANNDVDGGIRRNESSTTTSSTSDGESVNGWKSVRNSNIHGEMSHGKTEDDTIRGWRNVGVENDIRDVNDGSGDSRFSSDGYLDEYPVIVDEGYDGGTRGSKRVSFHEDVNASASMRDPTSMSPASLKSLEKDMAPTESTENQREMVKSSEANMVSRGHSISCDREIITWNGNGMDITIDETASDCDPEECAVKEGCIEADAAADNSSCLGNDASTSPEPHTTSPPAVKEPNPQPTQAKRLASKRSLRKARNINSKTPTATSMFHLEYNVDHSCSTPLERLARDVGNAFRQWHVHKGRDRHVSFEWVNRMRAVEENSNQEDHDDSESAYPNNHDESVKTLKAEKIEITMAVEIESENNQIMSMDVCMNRFANRSRKINEWMGDDATQVFSGVSIQTNEAKPSLMTPPLPPANSNPSELLGPSARTIPMEHPLIHPTYGSRCIRSKKIMFETTGFTPMHNNHDSMDESLPCIEWARKKYSIPLVLSLWDAPTRNDEENMEDDITCGIPHSLCSPLSYSSRSLLGHLGIASTSETKRALHDHSLGCSHKVNQGVIFNHSIPPLDTGLGRDLSSLFNIGQHITLSLDLDSVQNSSKYHPESKHLQDIQSLYTDIRAYIMSTIQLANEKKNLELQERRRRLKSHRKRAIKRRLVAEKGINLSKQAILIKNTDNENIVQVGSQSMSYEDGEENVTFYESNDKDHYDHSEAGSDGDDEISTSDDDTSMMPSNRDIRLNEGEIDSEVISSLTSILQGALNLAASENDCCIPVFGLWGSYRGGCRDRINDVAAVFGDTDFAAPSWIPSGRTDQNNIPIGRHASMARKEGDVKKLLLSSPIITGHCRQRTFRSTHRVYSIPRQTLPLHLSTLNGLSCVLLAQCPPHTDTNRVMLTSARHCYHSDVTKGKSANQEWRKLSFSANNETISAVEVYRETCRRQALFLLERASSPWIYETVPMWGPSEGNPLVSMSASVSWGVGHVLDSSHQESCLVAAPASPALLQLPLKIRSSNFVPTADELLDMEYSLQSTAFDPLGKGLESKNGDVEFGPREPVFCASLRFDGDIHCATLSANTRCVLAALLRCGSLGLDALPGHLTRTKVLTKLGGPSAASLDEEALAESEAMLRAALKHVGPVTTRLVDAMDWADVGTITSNAEVDRGIADALQRTGAGGLYPTPPVEVFAMDSVHRENLYPNSKGIHQSKGSPPGRLLSILFAHMARLRTPPSMMSLWLAFVDELRSRWDNNESLPNLGYVPGLDEVSESQRSITSRLSRLDHRVLGHRAHLAAFVNSSEPDPDRDQCIINQKLQVFNICIECKLSVEAMHKEHLESEQDDSTEDESSHSHSDDDEFFDPEEEVSFEFDDRDIESKKIEAMLKIEAAAGANPSHNRIGARCPVPDGLPLIKTGDQVYAPYLQRTMPMTDEEEEKQLKLSGVRDIVDRDERLSIRDRIQIAQRLQKPKLVSDMAAFMAANPGAVFEDFVSWYGNPQNPLFEDVNGETINRALEQRSKLSPEAAKVLALEEASEAIAILMSLRAFWEDSWEEAEPCPASEQQPLFDPYSTVEMVLHSFETIHPALLTGQALAVNLKNAQFVLESAAKPVKQVRSVQRALRRAVTAILGAVEMLTKDSLDGCLLSSSKTKSEEHPLVHVSTLTIQKCEEACNAIGEMELLLSRALTLWQHCPDPDLVDSLLQCQEGSYVILKSPKERSAFLTAIKNNQSMRSGYASANHFPEAVMREYVMCNDAPDAPCQLNARLVSDMEGGHSALLALTKSYRE